MYGNGPIAFPGLGIGEFTISRVAFTIFGIEIYWYGIFIALAFALGVWISVSLAKKNDVNPDNLIDLILWAAPVAIICARLYYVLFSLDLYDNFLDIINLRDGGVAIYGAVIGAVITTLIYCKIKKLNSLKMVDVAAPALLLGQAIGRWGNFVNQEAFGSETSLPWRMRIYISGIATDVHPTFLYESLWNLIGFIILMLLFKKRKYIGQIFLTYIAWYGFGRMIIEGLRTDSLMIFDSIRVSQVLAGLSLIISIILMFVLNKNQKIKAAIETDYIPQFTTQLNENNEQDNIETTDNDSGDNVVIDLFNDNTVTETSENKDEDSENKIETVVNNEETIENNDDTIEKKVETTTNINNDNNVEENKDVE